MVKTVYIEDLHDGDDLLNEPFMIEDLVRRETKDGRPYLLCTFRDRSGQINAVYWDVPVDVDNWVRPGLVTMVTGRVNNYRNSLQITTTDLNPLESSDMSHYLPSSERQQEEMVAELRRTIDSLVEPWKELTSYLLLDDEFMPKYINAPAARMLHHAYVGGLLEHSLSMARLAKFVAEQYPHVDVDLLVCGALLHDCGKALEYDTSSSFDFTDEGRLVGHVVRATIMVQQAADQLGDIPESQLRQLLHMITSHHGTMAWGAPVVPKTLEAILLHQIDLLDSRVQGYFDHLRNDNAGGNWTAKQSYMFETELWRPPDFE